MSAMIPRLSLEEMPETLAQALRPRVERLGYLGEFFRCAAHQPRALSSFMAFTEDLKEALPDRITELVALTVSVLMENAYERVQHERLSLKLGFGEEWLREVLALRPGPGGRMSQPEREVQQLVRALVETRGRDAQRQLKLVAAGLGAAGAMAVLLLVGRYVTHALVVNALELPPPVPSPLDAPR